MSTDPPSEHLLRPADPADASAIRALVEDAYGHYVERLGMRPRPMTDDYADVIQHSRVTVAEDDAMIIGVIVLTITDQQFVIDNVAVHPRNRGQGLGRTLLAFAEAQARGAGFDSIDLYTHEKMTENLAIYARTGYIEFDRRSQGDFSLVYMRKTLRRSAESGPSS